jgi:hypothetical protein
VERALADKIKITYVDSQDREICYLTQKQVDHFNLNNTKRHIVLSIGAASIRLKKIITSTCQMSSDRLYLSRDMENILYLPQGTVMQIRKIDNEHIEIGPYIGVFINQEKIELLNSGKGVTAYTHFSTACKSLYGLCCFFSIQNIDWERKLVNGLIRENGKWSTRTLPIPKIIYDRNVENNCRAESIELRRRLGDKHRILNPMPKLAKWETINALTKNEKLLDVIPKTIPFKSYNDIENSLRLFSSVYLKPDALSKGKGIFKISKDSNNLYRVEYRSPEENHIVNLRKLSDLNSLMEQYIDKGGGYIIQQEIKKALFRGNPFDFRFLFQKDYKGTWQPSGVAGRIAAPNSIITSPRSGGRVEDFSIVLKESFNEDISSRGGLYEDVVYYGREICRAIEDEFGTCLELGLDMTIDINKKIWVIEVNGKPLKVSLKRLNNPEIISLCNRRPIEYAVYLSGFKSADTGVGGLKSNNGMGG